MILAQAQAKIAPLPSLITGEFWVHATRAFIGAVALLLTIVLVVRMLGHNRDTPVRVLLGLCAAYTIVTMLQQIDGWNAPITSRGVYWIGLSWVGFIYLVCEGFRLVRSVWSRRRIGG